MEKNAPVNQLPTASSVRPVMRTVPISWKKSVWQDFDSLYLQQLSKHWQVYTSEKLFMKQSMLTSGRMKTFPPQEVVFLFPREEISRLNKIITPLVEQGQSVNQIYINHQDELMCSEKTIYNYIDACLFDVRNIDLPRKVKFRERYKKPEFKVDKGCRIDRNYKNFCEFLEKTLIRTLCKWTLLSERKEASAFLLYTLWNVALCLLFLRDANTSKSVTDIFHLLHQTLGDDLFKKLFPVILTDNGSEFSNPRPLSMGQSHLRA